MAVTASPIFLALFVPFLAFGVLGFGDGMRRQHGTGAVQASSQPACAESPAPAYRHQAPQPMSSHVQPADPVPQTAMRK